MKKNDMMKTLAKMGVAYAVAQRAHDYATARMHGAMKRVRARWEKAAIVLDNRAQSAILNA